MAISGVHVAIGIAAIAVGGGAAFLFFGGHRNFEECMVAEMRGQPQGMSGVVDKLCARRHHQEQQRTYITGEEWDWLGVRSGYAEIRFKKKDDNLDWTRGEARFSWLECDKIKDHKKEFNAPLQGTFTGLNGRIDIRSQFPIGEPKCMRIERMWGLYR